MKNIDIVHSVAGGLIILSLGLFFISPWWLLLTAFVGLNLFQFGITGFCPLEKILKKIRT